ncbi:hypothetical protein KDL44_07665 [bacterium]|nr:hypothetical protein [bacterium]
MSDREKIRSRVSSLRRVRRMQIVLEYLMVGMFWGAIPAALFILATKLFILPFGETTHYLIAGGLVLAGMLAFTIRGVLHRLSEISVANDIDVSLGTRERISSALALDQGKQRKDAFVKALVADAAGTVEKLEMKQVYPWRAPRAWRIAVPALLLAAGLTFVPQLNWLVSDSDRAEAKVVNNEGEKLLKLAQQTEKKAVEEKDEVLKEASEELEKSGQKLRNNNLNKKEALKELQRLTQKLESQSLERIPEGQKALMKELAEDLQNGTQTRELGEALENMDFGKFSQQLEKMLSDMKSGKLSQQQMEFLEQLQKALSESLKSEAAEGEGAEDLKQMLEDLKQALQNEQELRQMMQDALDALQQDIDNAAQQLQQGGMQQQSQQLQQLMQQMQQQMQQQGMVSQQSLQQMQQALQQAQQQVQQNQQMSPQQQQQAQQALQQALDNFQQQNQQNGQQGQQGQQSQQSIQDINQQMQQNRQDMANQMQQGQQQMSGGT